MLPNGNAICEIVVRPGLVRIRALRLDLEEFEQVQLTYADLDSETYSTAASSFHDRPCDSATPGYTTSP